ncbi:MAG: hypothetical protein L0Y61_07410 [Epsilonproteobacteria bacterium]|nr:hypothetical protein [Campylobacterota bacterium]
MNSNFDILKNLDNDDIYSKTYITYKNLDAIKNKDFRYFSRFKLMGFIDILSKRLDLDLSEFRAEASSYFDSIEPVVEIVEEPKKNHLPINIDKNILFIGGGSLVVLILGISLYFLLNSDSEQDLTNIQVSAPTTVVVTPPIEQVIENNTTLDENKTESNVSTQPINVGELESKTKVKEPIAINNDEIIKIIPKKKVWIGVINLDTKEKKEYKTEEELIIDKTKNQIIVVNGTYISLMIGNKEKRYDFDGRVRFIYKDGQIKEIKFAEFKALNDGKAWN